MKKLNLAFLVLIVSIILFIFNFTLIDFKNFQFKNSLGLLSNLLLMATMMVNIRDLKQKSNP